MADFFFKNGWTIAREFISKPMWRIRIAAVTSYILTAVSKTLWCKTFGVLKTFLLMFFKSVKKSSFHIMFTLEKKPRSFDFNTISSKTSQYFNFKDVYTYCTCTWHARDNNVKSVFVKSQCRLVWTLFYSFWGRFWLFQLLLTKYI